MKNILLLISLLASFSANAQWSSDPAVNTPICLASEYQDLPQIISDGNGGSIITWVDWRNTPVNMKCFIANNCCQEHICTGCRQANIA